jgi:glycosyltransferase involved in cell wall biosynthesis
MFSIIVPNYNNGAWLDKCLASIANQKYKDYEVIFVDDMSTDNSVQICDNWLDKLPHAYCLKAERKRWNGGARNLGLNFCHGKYVLYLDSDDTFADDMCLTAIDEAIKANNYPDLVRLSYYFCMNGDERLVDLSSQDSIDKIVHDMNVACWTKCVKLDKFVPFPENTLMEDVVQHISQLDTVESVAVCDKAIVKWNRNNANSCSNNTELQNGKWRSSLYRYYADLLDLRVKRPECQIELEKRRAQALNNIRNDRYEQ